MSHFLNFIFLTYTIGIKNIYSKTRDRVKQYDRRRTVLWHSACIIYSCKTNDLKAWQLKQQWLLRVVILGAS